MDIPTKKTKKTVKLQGWIVLNIGKSVQYSTGNGKPKD